MKVLLCHNFYQQWGGEDQVFLDEAAMLRAAGHEVVEYTRHNDELAAQSKLALARETFWSQRTFDDVRSLIAAERPALLHVTNTFPLISPAVYDAAAAAGVPVVQSLHNYRILCPNAFFVHDGKTCESCLTKTFAWPGVVRKCYRDSTAATAVLAGMTAWHRLRGTWRNKVQTYIALSEFSRSKFIEGGLPAERIVVKPNSMQVDPAVGLGQGGYAVFTGRLSPEKGIDVLLDAWQRLQRPVPLKVVGTGPLEHLARKAAAEHSHIEWLGKRAPDEVMQLVGDAACSVLPSINYEHCPKVLIEASALGTPVVAANIGAVGEMVIPKRNGWLVPAGDAVALAAKIDALFAAPAQMQSLRATSRELYDERYTAARNLQRLLEIYEATLGRKIAPQVDLLHDDSLTLQTSL